MNKFKRIFNLAVEDIGLFLMMSVVLIPIGILIGVPIIIFCNIAIKILTFAVGKVAAIILMLVILWLVLNINNIRKC